MLEQLVSKFQSYDKSSAVTLYGDLQGNPTSTSIPPLLEWDNSGCWVLSEQDVRYHNYNTGTTYRLLTSFNPKDWELYCKLYILVNKNREVRLCAPVSRELLNISGKPYEYTVFMRPGTGAGEINGQHHTSEFMTEFFETAIDDVYYLIKNMITVANESSNGLIPEFNIISRIKDDRGFYFYRNWADWAYTPETVVNKILESFRQYCQHIPVEKAWYDDWLERASTKWRTVYE